MKKDVKCVVKNDVKCVVKIDVKYIVKKGREERRELRASSKGAL